MSPAAPPQRSHRAPSPAGRVPRIRGVLAGLGASLLLATCGGDGAAAGSPAGGGPDAAPEPETWLVCDEPEVDFGEVVEGAALEHEFLFENRGPRAVRISGTRVSCGCTAAVVERIEAGTGARRPLSNGEPVEPGDRIALATTYHTRGKGGEAPRQVDVYCDQPSGVTSVTIRARIQPWLVVDPLQHDVAVLREDQGTSFVHTVRSAGGEVFRLEPTGQSIPPQLAVEARPLEPDPDGRSAAWEVTSALSPGLPRGVYSWPIHLRTDVEHPDAPALPGGEPVHVETSPFVSVKIVGRIGADPPVLAFMGVGEGQVAARTLKLVSHDPAFRLGRPELRLEATKAGEPCPLADTAVLSARPIEGEDAWEVQVLLEGLSKEVDYWFNARLVITTGHPDEPETTIQVSGRRSGPFQR